MEVRVSVVSVVKCTGLVLNLVAEFVVLGVILLTESEQQGEQMLHFSDRY